MTCTAHRTRKPPWHSPPPPIKYLDDPPEKDPHRSEGKQFYGGKVDAARTSELTSLLKQMTFSQRETSCPRPEEWPPEDEWTIHDNEIPGGMIQVMLLHPVVYSQTQRITMLRARRDPVPHAGGNPNAN